MQLFIFSLFQAWDLLERLYRHLLRVWLVFIYVVSFAGISRNFSFLAFPFRDATGNY